MAGNWQYRIEVNSEGKSNVTLISGKQQGVWNILNSAARTYLASREYSWSEGNSRPCSYSVEVEYRILPEEIPAPNNFFRVTVWDEGRTLVEIKSTTPTVNY